ncbi:hypothetical protein CYY_009315 [Polysphondylium violaceum]|uniref:Transmembrane protein n=1 Tax=Polysphondylium violaceum TaxID=133409 RepID=A0A8J4PTV6_9MYCE|nr:hypothetical protein CYY_009315 [Polysphondylium violaceum]
MISKNSDLSPSPTSSSSSSSSYFFENININNNSNTSSEGSRLTLRRNLDVATEAYKTNDVRKSKEAHEIRKIEDEPHKSNSFKKGSTKYIKTATTFGSYSILLCISIVMGLHTYLNEKNNVNSSNSNNSNNSNIELKVYNHMILFIVTASLFICGIGLTLIESTNRKIEHSFYHSEKRREEWEYDNYIEGEQSEMVELYCIKGMTEYDAQKVVKKLSKYKSLFIDIMMLEELNLMPVELLLKPMQTAFATFLSFVVVGLFSLTPFFVSCFITFIPIQLIYSSFLILSLMVLFIFGSIKSKFYTGIWWKEGFYSSMAGIVSILMGIGFGTLSTTFI